VAVQRDRLVADDLLGGHREERTARDGRVVRDDHEQAAVDARQPRHHAGRRRLPVVHPRGGVDAQLQEPGARVEEPRDPLADGEAALPVLRLDPLRPAALEDLLLEGPDLDQLLEHHPAARLVRVAGADRLVECGREERMDAGFGLRIAHGTGREA